MIYRIGIVAGLLHTSEIMGINTVTFRVQAVIVLLVLGCVGPWYGIANVLVYFFSIMRQVRIWRPKKWNFLLLHLGRTSFDHGRILLASVSYVRRVQL